MNILAKASSIVEKYKIPKINIEIINLINTKNNSYQIILHLLLMKLTNQLNLMTL